MLKVRIGVFETNSSSVHSITIVPEEKFKEWKNGKLIYDKWDEVLVDSSEIKPNDLDDYERKYRYYTYEDFFSNWERLELDTYHESYETESGDKIVAFGCYGHD